MDIELYEDDLRNLANLLGYVEDVANNDGLLEVEIRVKLVNDSTAWAILGFGEAGDPCVLRFEKDPAPVVPIKVNFPYTINDPKDYRLSIINPDDVKP